MKDGGLLYRIIALVLVVAGVFGVAFAAAATGLTPSQQAARMVVACGMLAAAAWLALRPARLERLLHASPELLVASGLLFAIAVAWTNGMADTPFWFATAAWIALGAAMLPGAWWLPYGLTAAAASLLAGYASGQNAHLGAQHAAGWVLVGVPVTFVDAAYVGRRLGAMTMSLRRLEEVLAPERDRIAAVLDGLAPVGALLARIEGLLEEARRVALQAPVDRREPLLAGVAESRAQIEALERSVRDPREAAGLGERLRSFCASYTHLAGRAEVRVSVAPPCEHLPPHLAIAVHQIVARALDNVCDRCRHAAAGPVRVAVAVGPAPHARTVRCSIDDDAGGRVPSAYGEGSDHSRETATKLGGRFAYEQLSRGVRVVVDLPLPAGPALRAGPDRSSGPALPALQRTISHTLRATRWAAGLSMVAGGLDITRGDVAASVAVALLAALAAEALLHQAGLRGERPVAESWPWVVGAALVAIAASGLVEQADRFQTAGWAATVMLELAWRYGWGAWLAVELARIPVVVLTLQAPTTGPGYGLAAQVLFPFGVGLIAAAARAVVRRGEELEEAIGSAGERWTAIAVETTAAQRRHDVVSPLYRAIDADTRSPELASLRRRLEALDDALAHELDVISRSCGPVRDLGTTVEATLGTMIAPVRVAMDRSEVHVEPPGYPGARIERFGRRIALLELLATLGEASVERCPPHPWGRRRLQRVDVRMSQARAAAPIYLTVAPVPCTGAASSLDGDIALLAAAAGVEVVAASGGRPLTVRLSPALS